MNKKMKIIVGASVWGVILCVIIAAVIASCSQNEPVAEKPSDEGLLLNDDLPSEIFISIHPVIYIIGNI